MAIKWISSPNKRAGRHGYKPEAVVIHIMEGSLAGTDSWFRNPESKVSAHYGVGADGEVHQYVDESDSAWHAGRRYGATWKGIRDGVNPNDYTIGIEHEGKADTPWSDEMYDSSAKLVKEICLRWNIPIDRDHVIGHREIYARKTCPGSQVSFKKLITLAGGKACSPDQHNLVTRKGSVIIRATVKVRTGPTTDASQIGKILKGKKVNVLGWTSSGQAVGGNPHWYLSSKNQYFWAGATESPVPGL